MLMKTVNRYHFFFVAEEWNLWWKMRFFNKINQTLNECYVVWMKFIQYHWICLLCEQKKNHVPNGQLLLELLAWKMLKDNNIFYLWLCAINNGHPQIYHISIA